MPPWSMAGKWIRTPLSPPLYLNCLLDYFLFSKGTRGLSDPTLKLYMLARMMTANVRHLGCLHLCISIEKHLTSTPLPDTNKRGNKKSERGKNAFNLKQFRNQN